MLKSKLLEIAASYGTITSRVNIEESPSPFQADESSKYLYLGGNSSQDICFLNSLETQNSGKNFNLWWEFLDKFSPPFLWPVSIPSLHIHIEHLGFCVSICSIWDIHIYTPMHIYTTYTHAHTQANLFGRKWCDWSYELWLLYFAECLSIVCLTILGASRSLVGAWSLKPWVVVWGRGRGCRVTSS